MDALDKMISGKRSEVSELLARAELLKAELSALELAAQLRPVTPAPSKRAGPVGHKRAGGGRRPGDISHDWRAILEDVYRLDMPVDYEMIADVAKERGNEMAMSSIRDRVRNLTKTGLMDGDSAQGFVVTDYAVERFGFTKQNDPLSAGSEANAGSAGSTPGAHNPHPAITGA